MNQPAIEEQNAAGQWESVPAEPVAAPPVAAPVADDDDDQPAAPAAAEAKPAEAAKPAGKPRNDPEARINQAVARQREAERRLEAAEKRAAELEARTAPKPAAVAPTADDAPDANDSAKYPGGEYDPKFLKDQARYEARQEFREQHAAQQAADEDTRKERDFDTRATAFVTRLKEANAVDAIDRRLLSGKPLSLLTSKERADIAKLPMQEQNDLGFICFLAEQWDGSDHDIDLVKYLSDPKNFQRLATLPPNQVIRELARVEAGLGAASVKETAGSAPVPKPKSQATPPIQPVRGSSQASGDDEPGDDASDDEWYRWNVRQAKRAAR